MFGRGRHAWRFAALPNEIRQQLLVAARDGSTTMEELQKGVIQTLSGIGNARLIDVDPASRTVVIDLPGEMVATAQTVLGQRFIVDVNAPLKY